MLWFDCFLRLLVEICRNPSEFSWLLIPLYVLYLMPYYAIISLQNLYVFSAFIKSGVMASSVKASNTLSAMAIRYFFYIRVRYRASVTLRK